MSYTAVVLTDEDHSKLVSRFSHMWDDTWEVLAHHMTMYMGKIKPEDELMLGEFKTLTVNAVAGNDKVVAVRVVPWEVTTKNETPHVTLAVNRGNGGKPMMSNELVDWEDVDPFNIRGRVEVSG